MDEHVLGERSRALEEEFFQRKNEALLERLRAAEKKAEDRKTLAEASGISNDAALDRLLALGIRAQTLAPLSLVPLVEVAWADGKLETSEYEAILSAARTSGMDPASPGYDLLEGWLAARPAPELKRVWMDYTRTLCAVLPPAQREQLQADILGRARAVAEAAGGFLGFGSRVSPREEEVLAELAAAFSAEPPGP